MTYPNYNLIVSAVRGDDEAMEQILKMYEPLIEEESGGDKEFRQFVVTTLIDAIRRYDLMHPEKHDEYLESQHLNNQ